MKIVVSIEGDRISSVLDTTRTFALVTSDVDGSLSWEKVFIAEADPVSQFKRMVELGAGVLICGAISWPLEAMLASTGLHLIANTCGALDEVAAAYFRGELTEQAFLLPGCPGRQDRIRQRNGRRTRNGW